MTDSSLSQGRLLQNCQAGKRFCTKLISTTLPHPYLSTPFHFSFMAAGLSVCAAVADLWYLGVLWAWLQLTILTPSLFHTYFVINAEKECNLSLHTSVSMSASTPLTPSLLSASVFAVYQTVSDGGSESEVLSVFVRHSLSGGKLFTAAQVGLHNFD